MVPVKEVKLCLTAIHSCMHSLAAPFSLLDFSSSLNWFPPCVTLWQIRQNILWTFVFLLNCFLYHFATHLKVEYTCFVSVSTTHGTVHETLAVLEKYFLNESNKLLSSDILKGS